MDYFKSRTDQIEERTSKVKDRSFKYIWRQKIKKGQIGIMGHHQVIQSISHWSSKKRQRQRKFKDWTF